MTDLFGPARNALQMRFLDEAFTWRFYETLDGRDRRTLEDWTSMTAQKDFDARRLRYEEKFTGSPERWSEEALRQMNDLFAPVKTCVELSSPIFETNGVDVSFAISGSAASYLFPASPREAFRLYGMDPVWRDCVAVEVKPLIGDDFPKVLRQVGDRRRREAARRHTRWAVLAGRIEASQPVDRIVGFFAASNVRLVELAEVEGRLALSPSRTRSPPAGF